MLRVLLLAATCWLGAFFLSLLAFGATASWAGPGMQRVPAALGAYFATVIGSLLASVVAVHLGAKRMLPDPGRGRIVVVLVFAALQVVTFAFLAFVGLLGFNR